MAIKREGMRKANFKMPYISDMRTEKTTYDMSINKDPIALSGHGPVNINMKKNQSNVPLGNKEGQREYSTEFKHNYGPKSALKDAAASLGKFHKRNQFEFSYGTQDAELNK